MLIFVGADIDLHEPPPPGPPYKEGFEREKY
jgi:hypothetical protein